MGHSNSYHSVPPSPPPSDSAPIFSAKRGTTRRPSSPTPDDPLPMASFTPQSSTQGTTSRRRHAWQQVGASVLLPFAILIPLFLFTWPLAFVDSGSTGRPHGEGCAPTPDTVLFWEPDIAFGRLTLGQAKLIDAAWNVVVGRGMQALMAWASYGVVMRGLTRMAERTEVSCELAAALTFRTTSAGTVWKLLKGVVKLKGWRHKMLVGWLAYSIVTLIAVPTLYDVASGYARFCSQSEYYQWGVASGWIMVIMPIHSVWVFGMYVVWMDAQHNSQLVRSGRSLGLWRGTLDIASAVSRELGPQCSTYSDTKLKKSLRKRGALHYGVDVDMDSEEKVPLASEPSLQEKDF